MELVKKYAGQLRLATGSSILKIDEKGDKTYINNESFWKGVAISCKFRTSELNRIEQDADTDPELSRIIDLLRS